MKKIVSVILMVLAVCTSLFAFTDMQLDLVHNPEFALFQRLQLDTVMARDTEFNKIYLSELALRDLVPTINPYSQQYYMDFNDAVHGLEMVNIQRDRLEFLKKEKQRGALSSLVPNAMSMATVAITTGLKNPLGAVISLAGMAVSSVNQYASERTRLNLEYLQEQWNLDDQEKAILVDLGENQYGFKCDLVREYGVSPEMTISVKDMENFVKAINVSDPSTRFIRISALGNRLEILPDYWRELAVAAYEMGNYQDALKYIAEYEKIYIPIIYHDNDYGYILKIKSYCINEVYEGDDKYTVLENIGDKILEHCDSENWLDRFYVMSLYMAIYRETNNIVILSKAYRQYPIILMNVCDEYEEDLEEYLSGKYTNSVVSDYESKIKIAEDDIVMANTDLSIAKKTKYDKSGLAYKILEDNLRNAEAKKAMLEEELNEFKSSSSRVVPPSSDFMCSLMDEYLRISERLGQTKLPKFKAVCSNFCDTIKGDYSLMFKYRELFDNVVLTAPKIIYDCDTKFTAKTFFTFGAKKDAYFRVEVPLTYIEFESDTNERILDSDDVELVIVINDSDQYVIEPMEEVRIETTGALNTSYLCFKGQLPDDISVSFEKPTKKTPAFIGVDCILSSDSGAFSSYRFEISDSSELYNQIISKMKYAKNK